MNYDLAVFLISDACRAIRCSYNVDDKGNGVEVKVFKTFDRSIKKGDLVVVPTDTRHKLTVCRVEETDVEPDFDTACPVQWIVGVVNLADFQAIKRQEAEAVDKIKAAEKRKKRAELREAMLADAEDDIKALPIYKAGDVEDGSQIPT